MTALTKPAPRRGRRRLDEGPALDRTRLIEALLLLTRRDGFQALNIRDLAAELGVSPRLLYHHVRDKDEMMELLSDAILSPHLPDLSSPDWERRLRNIIDAARAAYRDFPGVPAYILSKGVHRLTLPNGLLLRGALIRALKDAGLSGEALDEALILFSVNLMGGMVMAEGLRSGDARLAVGSDVVERSLNGGIDLLLFGIRKEAARLAAGGAKAASKAPTASS